MHPLYALGPSQKGSLTLALNRFFSRSEFPEGIPTFFSPNDLFITELIHKVTAT